jgi:hypothetical protein
MPLREFVDESGRAWLAWGTVPRSGANVRTRYAEGWLSFQSGDGQDRRRLIPVPKAWESASEDDLRAYLRSARPAETGASPEEMSHDVAQKREEEAAETLERDRGERTREGRGTVSRGVDRIREILSGIRIGRDREDDQA